MLVNFTKVAKHVLLAAIGMVLATQTATADVGFLLPNTFHTDERGRITAIASFSDRFPGVEHALRSDDFHVITPNGEKKPFETVQNLEQMAALFTTLDAPGIYKLSSGERFGRKGEVLKRDGAFVLLGADGIDKSTLPDGAPILTSQTATASEVYVRHGEADLPATLRTSGRLSVSLSAGKKGFQAMTSLRVTVTFDGAPLAGAETTLVSPYSAYTDQPEGVTSNLDENGETEITPDTAGPNVILVRHISQAPANAETDVRSYSTALVFEIFPNDQ